VLALAAAGIGALKQRNWPPFATTAVFFVAAYLTLGLMFWPYMIPYSLTVADAAASDVSLGFLFYGAIVILPAVAIYIGSVCTGCSAGRFKAAMIDLWSENPTVNFAQVPASRRARLRRGVSVVATLLFLTGCSSAPSRSILGSYFPSWMICVLLALFATILVHGLLVKVGIDKELPIPIVVYLAVAIAFSFSIWLLWLA
jgi:YtcA family/Cytochrome bd terminal oxidase subunit II